ncbi:MAG: hypothetical protein IH851_13575 [Armatimonadetes bacterium]|nr:hypothetical protein [Armatimonadota bacterium]
METVLILLAVLEIAAFAAVAWQVFALLKSLRATGAVAARLEQAVLDLAEREAIPAAKAAAALENKALRIAGAVSRIESSTETPAAQPTLRLLEWVGTAVDMADVFVRFARVPEGRSARRENRRPVE